MNPFSFSHIRGRQQDWEMKHLELHLKWPQILLLYFCSLENKEENHIFKIKKRTEINLWFYAYKSMFKTFELIEIMVLVCILKNSEYLWYNDKYAIVPRNFKLP